MYRFVAILVVLSLPQFASAESVSFGAGLDPDGGHIGGSADSVNNAPATGRVHWSGNAITIHDGFISGHSVLLYGTITRSNDPTLEGKAVTIELVPGFDMVFFTIDLEPTDLSYSGFGRVAVR